MAITAQTVIERDNLFRGLSKTTVERIAALGRRRVYEQGAVIFMRGDPGDSLCGVVSGRVRISASRPGGKEVFLNIIGPGDSFGEIALLDGMPRTATATAMTRTELSILQREPFLRLLDSEPRLARHLIKLLCSRVRWTAQATEDSALLSVPARIAKRLLSLADLHGRATAAGIKVSLSQEELGQFLGVSRQIVNQHLQSWKSSGWLELGRGNVIVRDSPALETLIRES
ncbi:MAG: Crp/Fnr family transcriptional regulator [Proteobacteria bacterium]|nr:Crp/Fnr family transcriptional regulator [Pseudomonadota bacterium]